MQLSTVACCHRQSQFHGAWIKGSAFLGMYLVNAFSQVSMLWGNLSVYVASYLYSRAEDPKAVQTLWPVSFFFVCWAIGMVISKTVYDRIGKRPACLAGIVLVNGGLLLSNVTVQHSMMTLALTFGAAVGLGCGINTSIVIDSVVQWTDERVGLSTASIVAMRSLGSIISNQMVTWCVNPGNLPPDISVDNVMLFSQPQILDRVPRFFLQFGAISFIVNVVGLLFLRSKIIDPSANTDTNSKRDTSTCSTTDTETDDTIRTDVELTIDSTEDRKSLTRSDDVVSSTPWEIVKSLKFHTLSLTIMFANTTIFVTLTFYKTFGLTLIPDDHFLTDVRTGMDVVTALSCFLSGYVADKLRLKTALVASTSLLATISVSVYLAPTINRWLFGVTIMAYGIVENFNYSISTVAILKLFGPSHFSTNYGLTNAAGIISILGAPLMISTIVRAWGWLYLFIGLGLANGMSMVLVIVGIPSL